MARNTTLIRSNYLWDESAAIYEHSLKLWEGLEDDLGYPILFEPARRAEPGPHPAGRARQRAPGRGEQAQRDRRRVARRGRGPQGLPDRQHVDGDPLPGPRRHLPAAGGHRQARLRRLGVRPARRPGRGRPGPGLRGHRLRHERRPGDRRADDARRHRRRAGRPVRIGAHDGAHRHARPARAGAEPPAAGARVRAAGARAPDDRHVERRARVRLAGPQGRAGRWGRASTRTTATASAARST